MLNPSTSAFATSIEKTTCNDVIRACDKALKLKNEEIKFSREIIDDQSLAIERLNRDLNLELDAKGAWYRNPGVLLLIGALAGALIATNGR